MLTIGKAADIGFPRPRGDEPHPEKMYPRCVGFPRPRGDEPRPHIVMGVDATGFPAHAGMNPTRACSVCNMWGFPAHAGMNPTNLCAVRFVVWFPRPRGDEPASTSRTSCTRRVSPPTRG